VGFDNVEEARFTLPPLTTVNQPLQDQGREAVRIVLEQLRDPSHPEQAVRHTELIARRSCGCLQGSAGGRPSSTPLPAGLGFDAALLLRRHHILADMARAARGELGLAGAGWDARLLSAAAEQIRGDSVDSFVLAYDDLLRRLLSAGSDPSVCNDVVSAMRSRLVRCVSDPKQRMKVEDLFHEARLMTTQAMERVHVARQMKVWSDARALLQAGAAIGSSRDLDDLGRAVRSHLPRVGIPRCFLVRLQDTSAGPVARVVLAERPDARKSDPTMATTYRAYEVLRQAILPGTDEHAFAVFPVQFGNRDRGLVILEIAGVLEGYGYETLRQVFAAATGRM
jgi:hypothetical protein